MTKKINRIEVWFNNGLFRAFPNITSTISYSDDGMVMKFMFGGEHEHAACINLNNVNFVEYMHVDDEE